MELSIDTSTRYASVGLSDKGETVAELTWRSGRNHSVELTPAIRDLLSRAAVEIGHLEAVFVARGPGGFSALRVGVSTSKALAVALDVPLIAVATLSVEAQPYLGFGRPVHALIDAGRNRWYVGRYRSPHEGGEPDYEVVSDEDLVAGVDAATLFCGEAVGPAASLLKGSLGDRALLAGQRPPTRRASVLAELAYGRWQRGVSDDPATLQPMYLRSAQIGAARRKWSTP